MIRINPNTFEIEISYGDNLPIYFKILNDGEESIVNEDVVFTIKKKSTIGYPPLIQKVYHAVGTNTIPITIKKEDFINSGIGTGIYYYDLYLKKSGYTLIEPSLFIVKEVVHNVQ